MSEIVIPHMYSPRPYQIPFLRAMDNGIKRAVKVWHRKAGKEKTDWNYMIKEALKRVGNYWYIFPNLVQARKVVWDGIDQNGVRFLDHIPNELREGIPNDTKMMQKFKNGSTIQMIGSEDFDTSIGGNPVGVAFSEYSIQDPFVWSYVRPILANNGGWATFNFTPRGENHAYDLFKLAKADPKNWFCELLTADDTQAISPEILKSERDEIVRLHGNDALFQQEYYCSFIVPLAGAYYAIHIDRAYKEARIGHVPIDPRYRVDTWWDLGKGDNMAVWLVQQVGLQIRLVGYLSGVGNGIADFIKMIREEALKREFQIGRWIGPHDLNGTEIFIGKTRKESASSLGVDFEVAPKIAVADGIDAVRNIWNRIYIDQEHCADGLNALKNYTKTWDDKKKMFLDIPYHNWASHPADALRCGAVMVDFNEAGKPIHQEDKYMKAFNRERNRYSVPVLV